MDIVKPHGRVRKRPVRLSAFAATLGVVAAATGAAQAQAPSAPAPEGVAQTAPPPPRDGVQTFAPDFFRPYNPVTAADMVNRVPGFEIQDGETLRGFGATAGNVLVNGERPSSKVQISEQLKRIPADAVARIELIAGSSSEADVRGQTRLVNVVLNAVRGNARPASWVLDLRHIQYSDRLGWGVQATKAFALGETAELSIDLQAPNLRGRVDSFEAVRDASGRLTQYRRQYGQPNFIGLQGAATLKWRPTAQDTLNFNAQFAPTWDTSGNGSMAFSPSDVFLQATFGGWEQKNKYVAEVAGDWEHRFSSDLSFKALALATFNNVDQSDIYRTVNPVRLINTQTLERGTESGERVARGVLNWKLNDAHTLELGAEGAFNFRDTTLDIFNDAGSGPVPQPLAVADARVEELRGDFFITDVWKLSPRLTLESNFTFEASRIEQTGDEQKSREFSYPKPRFNLTWRATPEDQLRLSLIRDVAQLDFAEFASSINVIDAFSTIGNPDLEPEKTWRVRGEWEKRFGPRGALTVAVFHDQVEDVQDLVVIGLNDAFGNLGDGTRTGVEVRGAAPLDALGLKNAELRFSGMLQETKVDDPLTGQSRAFSNERDWTFNVNFRQQIPSKQMAWGGSWRGYSERYEFKRIEEIVFDRAPEMLELFVETTAIAGLTVRLTVSNLFHPAEERVRTFYAGDRSSGIITRTETRKQKGAPDGTRVLGLRVAGTF